MGGLIPRNQETRDGVPNLGQSVQQQHEPPLDRTKHICHPGEQRLAIVALTPPIERIGVKQCLAPVIAQVEI